MGVNLRPSKWFVALLVVLAPLPSRAQVPYAAADIPVVPGTTRDPQTESKLRSGADSNAQYLRAYRIGASIEQLFRYYLLRLNAQPYDPTDTILPARPELAPIKYRVAFHSFGDVCQDPPSSDSGPAPTDCRKWLHGKDKRSALDRVRIPNEKDHWIEAAEFVWYRREENGALTRLRVRIRDIGLSPDWHRYTPLGQLIIDSAPVQPESRE
jgi:hypothetical protein